MALVVVPWGGGAPSTPADDLPSPSRGIVVTEPGTVIDGVHVVGSIQVKADDVTIVRSRVTFAGLHSVRIFDGVEGTRILDTTIDCTGPRTNGIVFGNYRAVRVAVNGCRNAFMSSDDLPATVIASTVDGEPFSLSARTSTQAAPTVEAARTRPGAEFPIPGPGPSTATARSSESREETEADGADQAEAVDETQPAVAAPPPPEPVAEPKPTTTPAAPPPSGGLSKAGVMSGAGPRAAATATMSGSEARQRLQETGLLERVKVVGSLDLSRVTRAYTVRDVTVDAEGARYGIQTMVGYDGVGSPSGPQVIEFVEVYGASSAGLYLRDVTVRHADVWGNIDNVKSADRVELYASWLHDQAWTDGAHADAIQIQYGVDQYFHWNVIDARYGERGGSKEGANTNAGLQTGSMLRSASARFHNNWWSGGYYTVRLGDSGPPTIDYQFRGNTFGRGATYGPVTGSQDAPSGFGGVFFDSSNVWEDTGGPV